MATPYNQGKQDATLGKGPKPPNTWKTSQAREVYNATYNNTKKK